MRACRKQGKLSVMFSLLPTPPTVCHAHRQRRWNQKASAWLTSNLGQANKLPETGKPLPVVQTCRCFCIHLPPFHYRVRGGVQLDFASLFPPSVMWYRVSQVSCPTPAALHQSACMPVSDTEFIWRASGGCGEGRSFARTGDIYQGEKPGKRYSTRG